MRKALARATDEYDKNYQNSLVSELEYRDGINFKKGERVQVNGQDSSELVIVSPNGTKYKLTVPAAGALSTTTTV